MLRNKSFLRVENLETRDVPAQWFAVTLNSPTEGVLVSSDLPVTGGGLTVGNSANTGGSTVVWADSPAEALQLAIAGSVSVGGNSYVFDESTVSSDPATLAPFLAVPTANGFEVRLEDLASTPTTSDWDYFDTIWNVNVETYTDGEPDPNSPPMAPPVPPAPPAEGTPGNPKPGEPIKLDPEKTPIYRGGKTIAPSPGEVRIKGESNSARKKREDAGTYPKDDDIIVPKTDGGVPIGPSTNLDPADVNVAPKGAHKLPKKLPDGLEALNDKNNHTTIVPSKEMTYKEYKEKLAELEKGLEEVKK
jgi:hypothetical protein